MSKLSFAPIITFLGTHMLKAHTHTYVQTIDFPGINGLELILTWTKLQAHSTPA